MATDMAVSSREASREGPSQEAGPGAGWPGGAASPGAGGQTQRALSPASRHSSSSAGPPSRRESPPGTKSVPSPAGHHHDPPGATEGAVAGQGAGTWRHLSHERERRQLGGQLSGQLSGQVRGTQSPRWAAFGHHRAPVSGPCAAPSARRCGAAQPDLGSRQRPARGLRPEARGPGPWPGPSQRRAVPVIVLPVLLNVPLETTPTKKKRHEKETKLSGGWGTERGPLTTLAYTGAVWKLPIRTCDETGRLPGPVTRPTVGA